MPRKGNAVPKNVTCHPDRKHWARGLCRQCYDQDYAANNRARVNAKARQWAADNPARRLAIKRKSLYGLDAATIEARRNAQDGKCKICLTGPAAHLDHDHASGIARGLLCGSCNRALGLFCDDPERIRRAANYLELFTPNTGEPVGQSTRGLT